MKAVVGALGLTLALIAYKWPKRKQEPVLTNSRICPVCKSVDAGLTSEGLCEDCGNIIY